MNRKLLIIASVACLILAYPAFAGGIKVCGPNDTSCAMPPGYIFGASVYDAGFDAHFRFFKFEDGSFAADVDKSGAGIFTCSPATPPDLFTCKSPTTWTIKAKFLKPDRYQAILTYLVYEWNEKNELIFVQRETTGIYHASSYGIPIWEHSKRIGPAKMEQ